MSRGVVEQMAEDSPVAVLYDPRSKPMRFLWEITQLYELKCAAHTARPGYTALHSSARCKLTLLTQTSVMEECFLCFFMRTT